MAGTKSTADILRAAKAHISEPENWFQGEYFKGSLIDPDTSCACALGAVRVANWSAHAIHSVFVDIHDDTPAAHTLHSVLPDGFFTVNDFNDDPNTTHADIMALFDRAIAAAEATQ